MMKKILVIDDEEWLRDMIQLALSQKGYEVLQASNGEEGIEQARKTMPDLILCDVNMGKVDGYLTLSSLRNQPGTAAIPFILMTGLADNAGMRHGMELGADDYLPKPFSIEALYAAVEARLKKSQTVRENAEKKMADLRDNITMMLPHELKTPLNGILAYGEILKSDAETLSPAEIAEMGQVIHDSGQRLERLIENFLIYTQIELLGSDPQRVSALRKKQTERPRQIIQARATYQAETVNRTQDLQMELMDKPVAISEEYLTKIVDELTHNAFKFSNPGTPISVVLFPNGTHLNMSISDHGRGLHTEQIQKVGAYMQFDRKQHEQQGLGLGLTIAKKLTEVHGGSLAIQSQPGVGTTVVVKLPLAG
jgi:signal transduction histidine kinase